jgi:dynamin 1-like protein
MAVVLLPTDATMALPDRWRRREESRVGAAPKTRTTMGTSCRTGVVVAARRGRGGAHDRQRSVSSTVHDRALNGPSFAAGPSSVATNHQRHSGQQHQHHQQNSMTSPLRTHSPMPGYANLSGHHDRNASAKESFLNYFFGGNPAHGELSGSSAAAAAARMGAGGGGGGGLLGGAGGAEPFGRENPLTGRKGLEGNAAAFEMKSLEKHLEPVSVVLPL